MSMFRAILIGLAPSNGGKRLPAVALILDSGGDWAMIDGGVTKPDAWMVQDAESDFAADTAVSTGLVIGFDGDGDPYATI